MAHSPDLQSKAELLAKKTGISEAEALDLIKLLGVADENSLLREARIIKASKQKPVP